MKHLCGFLEFIFLLIQLACSVPLSTCRRHHEYQPGNFTLAKHRDFYMNGTFIFAGLFPIHYAPQNNSTSNECRGKFNIRGFEEALAMLCALEQINNDLKILPGITIGADIKDTCSSVDFAIRKCLNFSFVKKNMESMMCERTRAKRSLEHDPMTVAIVGLGRSDVAMAVANFAGLFYVPVVSYASTSRLLSNRIRFKYFLRTVSSDTLMARAVIDFLRALKWNFIHVLYSDTDYGRSAIETFEHVLSASLGTKICLAVKRTFTQQTNSREIKGFLSDMRAEKNTDAKAVLLFTTMEDTELILEYFDNLGMKDYVFIATDHFTGPINRFQGSREMLRRIVGVTPHKGSTEEFVKYFERFNGSATGCPWLDEYRKHHHLKNQEQLSAYVPYVIDAVYATAYGLHDLLNCTQRKGCQFSPEEFSNLNRDDGFLKRIQSVKFAGVSRDPVSFDSNGNSLGAYDITVVNKETEQWEPIGSWISNTSNVLDLPENVPFLDLNLTKLRMFWQKVFNSSVEPTSFCGQLCPPGHLMLSDERHQSCCWTCVPCGTNEVSYNPVNGSCRRCPARYWSNENHTACLPIIPTAVRLSDPAGISVGVVAMLGVLSVFSVMVVYCRHGNTHIVRASSKVLSYIMLFGILLGYLTAVLILLERTETLCQIVLFSFSIGFCIVVGTLLIKTNRIHRIFSKRAMRKGTPPCLSDKWMVVFISGFVAIETAICTIIVFTSPDGGLKEVVYSEMRNEAFVQCKLASYANYNMALWWCFNSGLVLVCTYQAFLTRKVPGNYNEARFIAFNMMTISTDLLMFFLSYYATQTYYKDILVSSFLIVAATVTIACMFVPKVYVIVFRPEKNVDLSSTVNLGTLADDEDEHNDRKISTRSNTSVLSSLSTTSSNQVDVRENRAYHDNNTVERSRKISTVSFDRDPPEDWNLDGCDERPPVTSRDSNLSVRTVRFEDEMNLDSEFPVESKEV